MIFDGLRDHYEPLPSLALVRDAIGLALAMVCAVSFTILMWAVIP